MIRVGDLSPLLLTEINNLLIRRQVLRTPNCPFPIHRFGNCSASVASHFNVECCKYR